MKTKAIKNLAIHKSANLLFIFSFIFFAAYSVLLVYPFLWVFLSSLKSNREFFENMFSLPKNWIFANYVETVKTMQINDNNFLQMLRNSIFLTVTGTFSNLLACSLVAYPLAKYKFRGSKLIYNIAIFVQIIPLVGSGPSLYKLVAQLHLLNNLWFIWILNMGGLGFSFLILYACFKSTSWTYAEAAFMDGASNFKVFYAIMIPLAKPVYVALSIMTAITIWNDYYSPFLYTENYPTLALGIFLYKVKSVYVSNIPVFFGGVILTLIPILIIFMIFSKTIMQNTVAGGLKE